MINTEWIIVAAVLLLPLLVFGAFELAGFSRRRRERARARRSKQRPSVHRV